VTLSLPSAWAAQVLANEIEAIRNVGKVALELCTAVAAFSPFAHQARTHTKHAKHPADMVLGQMWHEWSVPFSFGLSGMCLLARTPTSRAHRRRTHDLPHAILCLQMSIEALETLCRIRAQPRVAEVLVDLLADGELQARAAHICVGTGLKPPTSAPGLGSPRPHLHRDWAHPSHIWWLGGLV
jgi:hypothetical protein